MPNLTWVLGSWASRRRVYSTKRTVQSANYQSLDVMHNINQTSVNRSRKSGSCTS